MARRRREEGWIVIVCGVGVGGGEGMLPFIEPSGGGRVPPTELGVATADWPVGRVKFVVVSAEVIVAGGGVVSPGALMVDVAPVVVPSCTTW